MPSLIADGYRPPSVGSETIESPSANLGSNHRDCSLLPRPDPIIRAHHSRRLSGLPGSYRGNLRKRSMSAGPGVSHASSASYATPLLVASSAGPSSNYKSDLASLPVISPFGQPRTMSSFSSIDLGSCGPHNPAEERLDHPKMSTSRQPTTTTGQHTNTPHGISPFSPALSSLLPQDGPSPGPSGHHSSAPVVNSRSLHQNHHRSLHPSSMEPAIPTLSTSQSSFDKQFITQDSGELSIPFNWDHSISSNGSLTINTFNKSDDHHVPMEPLGHHFLHYRNSLKDRLPDDQKQTHLDTNSEPLGRQPMNPPSSREVISSPKIGLANKAPHGHPSDSTGKVTRTVLSRRIVGTQGVTIFSKDHLGKTIETHTVHPSDVTLKEAAAVQESLQPIRVSQDEGKKQVFPSKIDPSLPLDTTHHPTDPFWLIVPSFTPSPSSPIIDEEELYQTVERYGVAIGAVGSAMTLPEDYEFGRLKLPHPSDPSSYYHNDVTVDLDAAMEGFDTAIKDLVSIIKDPQFKRSLHYSVPDHPGGQEEPDPEEALLKCRFVLPDGVEVMPPLFSHYVKPNADAHRSLRRHYSLPLHVALDCVGQPPICAKGNNDFPSSPQGENSADHGSPKETVAIGLKPSTEPLVNARKTSEDRRMESTQSKHFGLPQFDSNARLPKLDYGASLEVPGSIGLISLSDQVRETTACSIYGRTIDGSLEDDLDRHTQSSGSWHRDHAEPVHFHDLHHHGSAGMLRSTSLSRREITTALSNEYSTLRMRPPLRSGSQSDVLPQRTKGYGRDSLSLRVSCGEGEEDEDDTSDTSESLPCPLMLRTSSGFTSSSYVDDPHHRSGDHGRRPPYELGSQSIESINDHFTATNWTTKPTPQTSSHSNPNDHHSHVSHGLLLGTNPLVGALTPRDSWESHIHQGGQAKGVITNSRSGMGSSSTQRRGS